MNLRAEVYKHFSLQFSSKFQNLVTSQRVQKGQHVKKQLLKGRVQTNLYFGKLDLNYCGKLRRPQYIQTAKLQTLQLQPHSRSINLAICTAASIMRVQGYSCRVPQYKFVCTLHFSTHCLQSSQFKISIGNCLKVLEFCCG